MLHKSRLGRLLGLGAVMALAAAACSSSAASGAVQGATAVNSITLGSTSDPSLGTYLTGRAGMTLYVLRNDTPDVSTCVGSCAATWPPLVVSSGAAITGPDGLTGAFGTFRRADGTIQVTLDHQPLYYYGGDSAAGDTKGQGINGVWFVATFGAPQGSTGPAATPATATQGPATPAATHAAPTSPGSGYGY